MSFFSKVEAELKELFVKAPKWEATAAATLKFVAPLVETLLAFTDPAAAVVVDPLITKLQLAMATASVVLKDAGPVPTLQSSLTAITTNLTAIEAAAQIKDPATQAKFTAAVTVIGGEISAIISSIPATTK
jgi:hypothetical protein